MVSHQVYLIDRPQPQQLRGVRSKRGQWHWSLCQAVHRGRVQWQAHAPNKELRIKLARILVRRGNQITGTVGIGAASCSSAVEGA